jgi:DNA polymerase III subunit beta
MVFVVLWYLTITQFTREAPTAMQMSVARDVLHASVTAVQRATATRVIQPILSNILIEADADQAQVCLTATDMDFTIQTTLPAVVQTSGRTTLSAKKWAEIMSKLPASAPVQFTSEDGQARIVCDHSVFDLRTMSAEDYPTIQPLDTNTAIALPLSGFIRTIQQSVYAAAMNENNNVLGGVFMSLSPTELEMVATDGSRLARRVEALENTTITETITAIVPAKSLLEFSRLVGSIHPDAALVYLSIANGQLSLKTDRFYVLTRLIDGQYPQYRQLIPTENKLVMTGDKVHIIAGIERAAVMANERTSVIKMTLTPDMLLLAANTPDMGDSQDEVAITFTGYTDSSPFIVAFNYKYVLDALRAIPHEEIRMEMNGQLTPAIFKANLPGDGYLGVVMPVQVRG